MQANRELDLWGGSAQPTKYLPSLPQISGTTWTKVAKSLNTPSGLLEAIPAPFRLAEQLGLGNIDAHLECRWMRLRTVPGRGERITEINKLGVTITVSFRPSNGPASLIFSRDYVDVSTHAFEVGIAGSPQAPFDPLSLAEAKWNGDGGIAATYMAKSIVSSTGDSSLVTALVNQALSAAQVVLVSSLSTELRQAGDLHDAAVALSGAKSLLENYIALGMSRSLEENDLLRSLIYGNQRLPDGDLISAAYGDAITQVAISKRDMATDPSRLLGAAMDARIRALESTLTKILDRVEKQQVSEPLRSLDTTLKRLEVYKALVGRVR